MSMPECLIFTPGYPAINIKPVLDTDAFKAKASFKWMDTPRCVQHSSAPFTARHECSLAGAGWRVLTILSEILPELGQLLQLTLSDFSLSHLTNFVRHK